MRFTKDITIGEIPTASNSNYSALFQADGQVRKRTLGSIITQDIDAYLSGISVAFPTSVFNIADSSITPSQPNLVVSLKNQLAGTVFAAPETLNGTPSFRKLADVDLSETTVAFQDDIPTSSDYITTNTTQTGLSGNKTTSGVWRFENNQIPITLYRSSGNHTIRFTNDSTSTYLGFSLNGDNFVVSDGVNLENITTRRMWVDNIGLVSSKSGFLKYGQNDTQILLAGGGHRPVSDFALASSLGNYLPLAGGTMSGDINFTNNNYGIAKNGSLRLSFTGSVTTISGDNTGTNIGIRLRPQGDTVTTGEVSINGNGQINTANHGNSSQWKQAYDWGDFRDYGLGTTGRTPTQLGASENDMDLIPRSTTGFFYASNSALNRPINTTNSYPMGIHIGLNQNIGVQISIERDGTVYTRGSSGNNTWNPWVMQWNSNSFDPSGYVPTSRTITAGNGLSGGGNLTANRTITLGTPSAITLSSTNSVGTSSHTHAFNPGGTTAQYIRGDGSLATYANTTYSAGTVALLTAGTNTTNRVWSARNLHDGIMHLINQNADSIFAYSPQGGLYTTNWSSNALGQYSLAIGHASNATAQNATAVGSAVFTGGFGSTNVGFSSNVNKSLAGNFGTYNTNNHREAFTYGLGLQTASTWQTVIGRYNKPNGAGDIDNWTNIRNPIFILGVGQDEMNRKNSVSAFGDGRLDYEYDRDDTYWNDNTIPDIKWINENVGGGGGPGGNMNFAYIDPDNTHFFGNDMANGLLVPRSYIVEQGNTETDFGLITIRVPNDEGFYGHVDDSRMYSTIGVSVKDDIIVTQGCIATATVGIALSLGKSNNLIYVWDWNTSSWSMSWVDTVGIEGHRHDKTKTVIVIGQMVDRNGKDYFNVNPQIV